MGRIRDKEGMAAAFKEELKKVVSPEEAFWEIQNLRTNRGFLDKLWNANHIEHDLALLRWTALHEMAFGVDPVVTEGVMVGTISAEDGTAEKIILDNRELQTQSLAPVSSATPEPAPAEEESWTLAGYRQEQKSDGK